MKRCKNITPRRAIIFCICFLAVLNALAGVAIAGDWIEIPVVVNIIDKSDSSKVNDAIKKANEALKQAEIRVTVCKVNNNVGVGNNDANLTTAEGTTAQANGRTELANTCGPGKGMKITVANDVWVESPGCLGWSIHGDPGVFVEPDADPNRMGRAIAHEAAHSLTLDYDFYGPNDVNSLMYGRDDSNGTKLDPNEIEEIRRRGRMRGRPQWVMPRVMPGGAVAVPDGLDYNIDGYGAVLDSFFDVYCAAPGFDPCDPNFGYADLREITMFWDRPFDQSSQMNLEIELGGDYPAESFFDVFLEVNINKDPDPESDAVINMHVWGGYVGDPNIYTEATYENLETSKTWPLELIVHENHRSVYGTEIRILENHSLEVPIPAGFFGPGSDPFEGQIYVSCNQDANDSRLPGSTMTDTADPFEFSLTQPLSGAQMKFFDPYGGGGGGGAKFGICGSGFPANGPVNILMDGEVAGMTMTKADGTVLALVDKPSAGVHEWQLISEAVDVHDPNIISYTNATGYFTYCEGGEIEGDLDNDCDVDFYDFAKLADNWLAGT